MDRCQPVTMSDGTTVRVPSSRVWARSGRWEAKWRRMLAEPTGQDHRCSPYWSRSICGGCGGQEANCDKCGRLMCCEPTGQEGDQ